MRLARATPMYLRQLDSSTFENRALLSWPLKARRGAQPAGSTAHLLVRIELPEGARAASATRAHIPPRVRAPSSLRAPLSSAMLAPTRVLRWHIAARLPPCLYRAARGECAHERHHAGLTEIDARCRAADAVSSRFGREAQRVSLSGVRVCVCGVGPPAHFSSCWTRPRPDTSLC